MRASLGTNHVLDDRFLRLVDLVGVFRRSFWLGARGRLGGDCELVAEVGRAVELCLGGFVFGQERLARESSHLWRSSQDQVVKGSKAVIVGRLQVEQALAIASDCRRTNDEFKKKRAWPGTVVSGGGPVTSVCSTGSNASIGRA